MDAGDELTFDQWIEEKLPNGKTQRVMYSRRTPQSICEPDKHYFELESSDTRFAKCRYCIHGIKIIAGIHHLEDGKVVESPQKLRD